jgi:CRP/FNR family cyclic AMP-dependent transcriptional regulator
MSTELAQRLSGLATFAGASDTDLRAIAEAGSLVTVPQGWSLIWEKTGADKAYVVLSGDLDVRRNNEVVGHLTAGDIVGEVAIVSRRLRTATVVAASPLEVLHFTREAVERLYADVPAFRASLDRAVLEHA